MFRLDPIIRQKKSDRNWQVRLLKSGEPFRASSLLASNGVDIAVFDTGMPQHRRSLVAALAKLDVEPHQVTHVFNTHAHVDHSHNNSLFQNAKIFCSRRDREWMQRFHDILLSAENPSEQEVLDFYPEMVNCGFNKKVVRKILAIEKMVWDSSQLGCSEQTFWLEESVPPDGISVLQTPGHSPHHTSFIIRTSERPVLFCGDALLARDEETSLSLIPPHDLASYRRSQAVIRAFDGIIVPGHGEPFDNRPVSKKGENPIDSPLGLNPSN